jgi:hypothetical protein
LTGLRSLWTLLLTLASVTAVTLLAAPGASAGTYTVFACSPTDSPGGWQPVNTFPSGLIVGNLCGGPAIGPNEPQGPIDEGALFAEDGTNTTADIPNGAEAGWSFAAPTGTSIAGLTYWRSLHAYDQQSLVPGLWTGEGATLESCQSPPEGTHECNSLNNQGAKTFSDLDASSLIFGVRCNLVGGGEYCVPAAPGERHAQADLYSTSVTLSEASSPTISSVSGAGWSAGYLSGEVPLSLSASDYSGIASMEVRSALGVVLASAPQSCDYYLSVPCPNLSGATIGLNTADAPDGPQTLILQVKDAAGNVTTVTSQPVTIDNHGPGAPNGLTATLDGAQVVLSWSNPTSPPVPLANGYVQLCQASCGVPLAVASSGPARIATPPAGTYTVRLYLTDAAGKSSPFVSVPLTIPPATGKGTGKETLHAVIDSHGRLYVAGPVPKDVNAVRVCWHSKRGKRALGSRCVTLHVEHGRISVTFHPSARARRGRITVTVSKEHSLIARLMATKVR